MCITNKQTNKYVQRIQLRSSKFHHDEYLQLKYAKVSINIISRSKICLLEKPFEGWQWSYLLKRPYFTTSLILTEYCTTFNHLQPVFSCVPSSCFVYIPLVCYLFVLSYYFIFLFYAQLMWSGHNFVVHVQ